MRIGKHFTSPWEGCRDLLGKPTEITASSRVTGAVAAREHDLLGDSETQSRTETAQLVGISQGCRSKQALDIRLIIGYCILEEGAGFNFQARNLKVSGLLSLLATVSYRWTLKDDQRPPWYFNDTKHWHLGS